jgi:hypothetical protein
MLTSTTALEDRPSTRSINAFPSRSNEALGSSWLPANVPTERWLRSLHLRRLVNQHLRSRRQRTTKHYNDRDNEKKQVNG